MLVGLGWWQSDKERWTFRRHTTPLDDQLHMAGEKEEDVSNLHTWMDGSAIH